MNVNSGNKKILFIGDASTDTYHIAGKTQASPGGAGMYAALAAARMGADVLALSLTP